MTRGEIKALADGMAPAVRMYFAQAIAPLTARLDALERRLGDPGHERAVSPPDPVEPLPTPNGRRLLANALAGKQIEKAGAHAGNA